MLRLFIMKENYIFA